VMRKPHRPRNGLDLGALADGAAGPARLQRHGLALHRRSYAQGMALNGGSLRRCTITKPAAPFSIAQILEGGCIIRPACCNGCQNAYDTNPQLTT